MERFAVVALALLLAACATAPVPQGARFLDDARFAPPSERIDVRSIFALSEEMRAYLATEIAPRAKARGRQLALVDAFYATGDLRLEYDAATTRNASQAFAARAGNCLSLVIMTAAFAKELDLRAEYRKVYVDDTWARAGDMYLAIGHVNVTLAKHKSDDYEIGYRVGKRAPESGGLTIDFLPPEDQRRVHSRVIGEDVVVAMYLNNRAVESLAAGRVDDAYWFARAAVLHTPAFPIAYNTLGAVYQRHGDLALAEAVLRHVLEREPANTRAMANLVRVLADAGKAEESARLAATLARMEPEPPFAYFKRGMAAMHAGDLHAAKASFEREVARDPEYHEFHFWLAVAHVGLGENDAARAHLRIALRNSTTRSEQELYAAKLSRLNAVR